MENFTEKIRNFIENWLMFLSHQEYFMEKGHAKKITPLPGKINVCNKKRPFQRERSLPRSSEQHFGGAMLVF